MIPPYTCECARQRILGLLAVRPFTQKNLLVGIKPREFRDAHVKAINELLAEGVIEIISRRPAISSGGTAIGWKNTKYDLVRPTS